jgi:hypothetical protein
MSFSECLALCIKKGWAQGDQSKMMGLFSITRRMADQLAEACELEFVRLAREHKQACLEAAKKAGIVTGDFHGKPVRSR